MSMGKFIISISFALSVVAVILALWPAVADAPWETSSREEHCLRLTEAAAAAPMPGTAYGHVMREGSKAGCWESEEERRARIRLAECIRQKGFIGCATTP